MQVLKFIREVLADTRQQEALCPEPAELHMLWQILQLLCHHKGEFRSADVAAAKLNAARPGGLPYKCSLHSASDRPPTVQTATESSRLLLPRITHAQLWRG